MCASLFLRRKGFLNAVMTVFKLSGSDVPKCYEYLIRSEIFFVPTVNRTRVHFNTMCIPTPLSQTVHRIMGVLM